MNTTNTFMNALDNATNYTYTENGGLARAHLDSAVYQMFAVGGSYRARTDEDCILLFKNALEEDEELALKCLFYIRDIKSGLGERRFFRVCYKWLVKNHLNAATRNAKYIEYYGRYDDFIYSLVDTPLQDYMLDDISNRLKIDMTRQHPSLCGKWAPSINASSRETRRVANLLRNYMGLTQKEYRKMLSELREKIKVTEKLMSANRWDEIDFAKVPSKAGLNYLGAFSRREETAQKYKEFILSNKTKVHADTLFPYEIVNRALDSDPFDEVNCATLEKYWNDQKDYFQGKPCKILCVVDTSFSMRMGSPYTSSTRPINVAISLGMYCAERIGGPFKDHFITFSREPRLVKIEGTDFCDKVRRISAMSINEDTNLEKVFLLLKDVFKESNPEDRPDTIIVLSDMEINQGMENSLWLSLDDAKKKTKTMMTRMRDLYAEEGLVLPHLVYWNLESRNRDLFLDDGPNVSYVSGMSPTLFESILSGKTGYDMMIDKLVNSGRYESIK